VRKRVRERVLKTQRARVCKKRPSILKALAAAVSGRHLSPMKAADATYGLHEPVKKKNTILLEVK
jgi:hypothetical protein